MHVKDIFLLYFELWASKRYIPFLFWLTINIFVKPASWINHTTPNFPYPPLPFFKQFLCVQLQPEALSIILQLLTFNMIFPAFSKDHFHMTQQCIQLVFNLKKSQHVCLKTSTKVYMKWRFLNFLQHNLSVGNWLTCLDQTILPDTVGKSRTLLILQAVLWIYWTYKELYPSCKRCLNFSKLLSAQFINSLNHHVREHEETISKTTKEFWKGQCADALR